MCQRTVLKARATKNSTRFLHHVVEAELEMLKWRKIMNLSYTQQFAAKFILPSCKSGRKCRTCRGTIDKSKGSCWQADQ